MTQKQLPIPDLTPTLDQKRKEVQNGLREAQEPSKRGDYVRQGLQRLDVSDAES